MGFDRDWMRSSEVSPVSVPRQAGSNAPRTAPLLGRHEAPRQGHGVVGARGVYEDESCSVVSVSEMGSYDSPSRSPHSCGDRGGVPRASVAHCAPPLGERLLHTAQVKRASPMAPAPQRLDVVTLAAHDARLSELQHIHEAEMRHAEGIHARKCGEFAVAVEDLRAQRDKYRDRCDDMCIEVDKLRRTQGRRYFDNIESVEQEKRVIERRVTELETEREKQLAEVERLKFEVDRLYELSRQQDAEARRAFKDVKADHEQLTVANRELAQRLQEATVDFQALERRCMSLQDQSSGERANHAVFVAEMKSQERQLLVARKAGHAVLSLFEDMRDRINDRAALAKSSVVARECRAELHEFSGHLDKLLVALDVSPGSDQGQDTTIRQRSEYGSHATTHDPKQTRRRSETVSVTESKASKRAASQRKL